MNIYLAIIGGIAAIIALLFVAPIIFPLFGALAGLVVGWVFDDTSRAFLDAIGLSSLEMWQFGAMLAFVSAFFRPNSVSKG